MTCKIRYDFKGEFIRRTIVEIDNSKAALIVKESGEVINIYYGNIIALLLKKMN